MRPKRKQKSRLNSLNKSRSSLENLEKSTRKISNNSIIEENSNEDLDQYKNETEACDEVELEESHNEIKKPLSRTSLLVQDYLEFKAARSIQCLVRGWLYRIKYKRKRLAAIIIQSEWRRFYCQRLYFRKVEETLQQRIEQHFYCAAQKIQAFWRGWWVRHHIHDHSRLMRLQLLAGEDLLYCVAFKLHHLLRTHQIPGVYSLRNSNAFSNVEQLLASLTFTTCNQKSLKAKDQRRQQLEESRKQHKKSAYGTKIPFSGHNINNICASKCAPLYNVKDADLRMAKILQMYEEANREISKPKVLKKKLAASKQPPTFTALPKSSSFCSDVVNSMKKWKIITENKLCVDSNIFKKPQNVENFLQEIQLKMGPSQGNCYCSRELLEELTNDKQKLNKINQKAEQRNRSTTHNNLSSPTTIEGSQSLKTLLSGASLSKR